MTLWTTHAVTGQHALEKDFQGWHVDVPGRPVEVARTEMKQDLTDADAWALFHKAVQIDKHSTISRLFNQDETVAGYMLSTRGVPEAFIMKIDKEKS